MSPFYRFIIFIVIFTLSYLVLSCGPSDPVVGSPGAGIRWKFSIVSGNGQSTAAFDTLQQRLIVKLETLQGDPIDNEDIRFSVIYGSGQVQKPSLAGDFFDYVVPTDPLGIATSQFLNFGGDSTGVSRVRAQVEDSTQFFVEFTIGTI